MTRIAYLYSRLPRTHSLHFDSQRQHTLIHIFTYRDSTLSLILSIVTSRDSTHSLSYILTSRDNALSFTFSLTETAHTYSLSLSLSLYLSLSLSLSLSLLHFHFQQSTPRKCIHSATFSFLVLLFWLDFFQLRTQRQKFRQTPKETNNQHGRRHVPPRTGCYISIYIDTLNEIPSPHTLYSRQNTSCTSFAFQI